MPTRTPHFLLFSRSHSATASSRASGIWEFELRSTNNALATSAADEEPGATGERLELLAIVRGLEALDQPSKVTLVTRSTTVLRGLRYGISQWRENEWEWERFGQMTPVKHRDLWQRIDQAMQIHVVDARPLEPVIDDLSPPLAANRPAIGEESSRQLSTSDGKQWRVDRPHQVASSRNVPAESSENPRIWNWLVASIAQLVPTLGLGAGQ